jgi:hypothetical protein
VDFWFAMQGRKANVQYLRVPREFGELCWLPGAFASRF